QTQHREHAQLPGILRFFRRTLPNTLFFLTLRTRTLCPSHSPPKVGHNNTACIRGRCPPNPHPLEGTGFEPSVPRQEKWSMPSSSDQTRVGRTLTLGGGAESSLEGRDIELSVLPKDIPYFAL